MKKILNMSLSVLMAVILSSLTACTDNNEPDYSNVNLKSHIVGTWQSYYLKGYGNNQEVDYDITKTNEMSACYIEIIFASDGKAVCSYWNPKSDNASEWKTEYDEYSISGNSVIISEPKSENEWNTGIGFNTTVGGATRAAGEDESLTMVFEPSNGNLAVRITSTNVYGIDVTGYIYFRKIK